MSAPFDNLFNKAKAVAKQAADQGSRQAKILKLKASMMTLNQEKNKGLQTIGNRVYILYTENKRIDGSLLYDRVKDELSQIEKTEARIGEIEAEIAELQTNAQHIDVTDVTEE